MRQLLLALVLALAPGAAGAADTPTVAPTVDGVLAALAASPEQPTGYTASVALHVRLRVFPFIRMTLHGQSWYKRPGLYRFVFRGVPLLAQAFSDMKYDLGDPSRWSERYDVAFALQSTAGQPVLRLTPKSAMQVKTFDVALDPTQGRILRATWTRKDGGVITLVQTYAQTPGIAGHAVVAKQDATIDLPRMKASLEADYADFRAAEDTVAGP